MPSSTYFSFKLLELLVLRLPVCLDLLLGLVSCFLYTFCAIYGSQFALLPEFLCACKELCSHSLAATKLASRHQFIPHVHSKPTSLNNLLSFPLSLYSISFSSLNCHHSLLRRVPTSSRVWIPAEFCAECEIN